MSIALLSLHTPDGPPQIPIATLPGAEAGTAVAHHDAEEVTTTAPMTHFVHPNEPISQSFEHQQEEGHHRKHPYNGAAAVPATAPTPPSEGYASVVKDVNAHHHHNHQVSLAWKHVNFKVAVKNGSGNISTPLASDDDDGSAAAAAAEPANSVHTSGNESGTGWKTLLHDMSGIARAGRVLAIMGPSGAGKTTLMSALAGRLAVDKTHVLDGSCELNGVPFAHCYKPLLTVVTQDDIVMGKETPRDALLFSAQMRLGLSAAKARERVEEMLSILRLEECADTFLGIPGVIKGVSGGEKKRVNIGCELISDPSIVIMDEPTTGLDSVNAARIGTLMRDLAKGHGRTVICTVHTPSSELFEKFDDLLLLAKGHVIYHGPREGAVPYFGACLGLPVPPQMNPIEHYMDSLQCDEAELQRMAAQWRSHLCRLSIAAVDDAVTASSDAGSSPSPSPSSLLLTSNRCVGTYPKPGPNEEALLAGRCEGRSTNVFAQVGPLLCRAFRMFRRDPANIGGRGTLTAFAGILLGLFFFNLDTDSAGVTNVAGVLFLVSINQLVFSMMPGVMLFPTERAIFLNEQSASMYHPAVYTFTRIIAEVPTNILFPIMYVSIVYWMAGLKASAATYFASLLVCITSCIAGFSLGMFVSAILPRLEVAMAFLPVCVMPIVMVGGLFANTDRLEPYFVWLNYISFTRYTYASLMVLQYKGRDICPPAMKGDCMYQTGDDYLRLMGFDEWNWWMSPWILVLFILFLWSCAAVALTVQGLSRRGSLAFKAVIADDPDVELRRGQQAQRQHITVGTEANPSVQ